MVPFMTHKGLLERLLQAAEEGRRMGSVIEILVLLALAHEAQGDIPLALVSLERALTLAEPEGYVRIFVDEGEPMASADCKRAAETRIIALRLCSSNYWQPLQAEGCNRDQHISLSHKIST